MRDILPHSKIAIVGGGRVCKAILEIVLGENFSIRGLKIVGVADINEKAEGFVYAREKGIHTAIDFKEFYEVQGLDLIIELTGDNEILEELKVSKPEKVRVIDHFEAMSVWDFLQIEEARVRIKRDLKRHLADPKKIKTEFDLFSQQLARIVEERTRHLQSVERELVERGRALSQIIQGTTIPTFVINKDHIVTHWNRAIENLTGYSAEDIVGTNKQWLPFRHERRPAMADAIVDDMDEDQMRQYYGDRWRRSALIEGAYEAEEFFPHIGESGKWLFFTAAPIKGPDGDTVGSIETFWDTTERREAQEALQRARDELEVRVEERTAELRKLNEELRTSEEKYRTLFDNAPNSIFIMDQKSLDLIDVNATALESYRQSREELLKSNFLDLLYEEDKDFEAALKELTVSQCAFYPRRRHRRGGAEPFYVNIVACHVIHMGTACLIATTTDITENVEKEGEIKGLQEELIKSERLAATGQTVAGLAHYIKNILNGLKGGIYVLNVALDKNDADKIKSGWAMIERNLVRTTDLVLDLLAYSKEREPEPENCLPNEIVKEVCSLMESRARENGIEMEMDLDPRIGEAYIDPKALHRSLLNLVSNAIDACIFDSAPKKRWKVRVTSAFGEDHQMIFEVADNGMGMDAQTKERLFSSLFSTKGERGTGLGLLVTEKIVKENGGRIEVETSPGKGATFSIYLPFQEAHRVQ